jgi:hypothetical protein
VICAQRTPIAWRLPELEPLAEELPMRPFEAEEVASFARAVLPGASTLLVQLLLACTAGFPLALAAWRQILVADPLPLHAAPADPRLWRAPDGSAYPSEQILLAIGATLLRSFDKAALRALFASDCPAGQQLAQQLGPQFATLLAPGRELAALHYVRARRLLAERGWIQPSPLDPERQMIAPSARAALPALLGVSPDLSIGLDAALGTHFRSQVERDPFRAQGALMDWLYHTAGTHERCASEWARLDALFALLRTRLAMVLGANPLADIRLLSDFYTDADLLQRLQQRAMLEPVEAQLLLLTQTVRDALAVRRGQGLRLAEGQEQFDVQGPRHPLLRLPHQALSAALARVTSSLQALDLAVGPIAEGYEELSPRDLQERDPRLYGLLRTRGVVERGAALFTPMLDNMLGGERTLLGRMLGKRSE